MLAFPAAVEIQILMSPGCGHGERTAALVAEVVRELAPSAEIGTILVTTHEDAARHAFPGSPTVRVNGVDIEPDAPVKIGLG